MSDRPTTIAEGLVPLGPLDTYNGVPVSSFCMACRNGIAQLEHRQRATFSLCVEDTARMLETRGVLQAIADDDTRRAAAADILSMPLTWVEMPINHPARWHWDDHDGSTGGRGGDLLDADDVPVIATIPTGPDSARIEAATRRVAALIAAAPEMSEMLRRLLVDLEQGGASTMGKVWHARIESLLAHMDAVSKS